MKRKARIADSGMAELGHVPDAQEVIRSLAAQPKRTRRAKVGRTIGAVMLSGALVFATTPVAAFAEGSATSVSQSSSQMGATSSSAAPGDAGGAGGADTMAYDYSGSYSGALTADGEEVTSDGESYSATDADQNAALVENGGTLTLTGGTLEKSGDDTNGDNCNFYGVNSILLSVGESSLAVVSDTDLSATSEGSNGIFATDSATVLADDVSISTTAGNSRGLDATYGGTIIASDLDISTQGDHSAALATDRGGGYISVTDSTLSTAGSGSPLIYSTGDIEVSDVTGTSSGSQICGMEGLNTILINDSDLESTHDGTSGSDPVANGIIIYQSTSGDAESTTGESATFQAADSTLTSAISSGSMFYLTNTSADIVLSDTTLDFDSDSCDLLMAAGNDANNWGTAGSNGATVTFTGIDEELSGDIEADTISSVTVYLTDGTTWIGAANIIENANGSTSDAPITINVDDSSTWVVTEDCTVSALTVADGGQVVDENGDSVTIVANGETVVEGTSDITVTVSGTYSSDYDASGAGTLSEELIDRSDFDEQFGTETSFAMGDADGDTTTASDSSQSTSSSEDTSSTNPIVAFFRAIGEWFASLFT